MYLARFATVYYGYKAGGIFVVFLELEFVY